VTTFPEPLRAFAVEHVTAALALAYLEVDATGRLCSWGGDLHLYGVEGMAVGRPATEVAPFLEGLLPLGGRPFRVPEAQLLPDRYADVHLLPGRDRDWVVFLDCTEAARARQLAHQRGHELARLGDLLGGQRAGAAPSLAADVVGVLELAVLVHTEGPRFRVETAPAWLRSLISGVSVGDVVDLPDRFPFLQAFMEDAESAWSDPKPRLDRSGIWVEQHPSGVEIPLEALAARTPSCRLLLLRMPWSEYAEQRTVLTRARSSALEYDRLQQEIEKKELLVRCIVHDLANPLAGIKGALDLIARASVGQSLERYLSIALRLCDDQLRLIRSILDAFGAELGPGIVSALQPHEVADAPTILRSVHEKLLPSFEMRGVVLELCDQVGAGPGRVAIDAASLERVLLNLAENALRHSPKGSSVTMRVGRQGESFTFAVDDRGPGVPPELEDRLFEKFVQSGETRGKVGLGLYFCRITAERWRGAVGHENLPEGGSSFWVTLPAHPGG
jgi:hypothetical protein